MNDMQALRGALGLCAVVLFGFIYSQGTVTLHAPRGAEQRRAQYILHYCGALVLQTWVLGFNIPGRSILLISAQLPPPGGGAATLKGASLSSVLFPLPSFPWKENMFFSTLSRTRPRKPSQGENAEAGSLLLGAVERGSRLPQQQ